MKAAVVGIKGHYAAALMNNGCVTKIKNENYTVGQVIEIAPQKARMPLKIAAWAASAAAAVMMAVLAKWLYFTPYMYVSLDVNPSIEYSVNRFDRVLSVRAVNNDGTEILKDLNLTNKTIDEAVKDTVQEISKKGYFKGTDPGGVEIATSGDDRQNADNLAQKLESAVKQATGDNAVPVEVEAVSVDQQQLTDAHKLGTTPGKLNLVEKLKQSTANPGSFNLQEWLKKPVKTIMKAIKDNKKASEERGQEEKNSGKNSSSESAESSSNEPSSSAFSQRRNTVSEKDKTSKPSEKKNGQSTHKSEQGSQPAQKSAASSGAAPSVSSANPQTSSQTASQSKQTNSSALQPAADTKPSTSISSSEAPNSNADKTDKGGNQNDKSDKNDKNDNSSKIKNKNS